ncbi:MAG: TadE family type IV pilus minor pilin [Actinomycetes bacterium]
MVTVETAFATLVLAAVAVLAIGVAGALFALGQCQVVANEVARQAARGDSAAVARASADAPAGAEVSSRREGGTVIVEVRCAVRIGPARWPLAARAAVLEE